VVEVAAASDVAPSAVERLAAVRNRLGYDAAAYVSLRFAAGTTTESVEILGREETRAVISELDVRAAVESAFGIEFESARSGEARPSRESATDADRTTRADTRGGDDRGAVTQLSYSADERAAALVSQALGDSVTERRLLATGPAGPLSEASLAEHLRRSEQPQFLLENRWRGVTSDRHGTIAPDDDYRALAALTGERVLVVVGTHDGDLTVSLPYGAITGVESSAGVTKRRLTVETDDDVYDLWASADAIGETELAAAAEFVANRCDEGAVWTESEPHVSAFESHAVETTRRELLQRAVGYGGGVLALYRVWTRLTGGGSSRTDSVVGRERDAGRHGTPVTPGPSSRDVTDSPRRRVPGPGRSGGSRRSR
jgi:hypothetical protein